jgi:hypothetical protein
VTQCILLLLANLKVNPLGNVLEGGKGLSKDKNKQASELRARLRFWWWEYSLWTHLWWRP